jgi:hypothetical protein
MVSAARVGTQTTTGVVSIVPLSSLLGAPSPSAPATSFLTHHRVMMEASASVGLKRARGAAGDEDKLEPASYLYLLFTQLYPVSNIHIYGV